MYCPDCGTEMGELCRAGSGTPAVYFAETTFGCGLCEKVWVETIDTFEGKRTITEDPRDKELILGKKMVC